MCRVLCVVWMIIGWFAVVGAQEPQPPRACPEGRAPAGDLGISGLHCVGGSCALYVRHGEGFRHQLSTEPRLFGVKPDGPSAGRVRENDVLVAIDGTLITTPAGGRRLARIDAGQKVELWLRRDGRDIEVSVTAAAGCGFTSLRVRAAGGK
jgi:S1-C subfamily serine protease